MTKKHLHGIALMLPLICTVAACIIITGHYDILFITFGLVIVWILVALFIEGLDLLLP